jgi:hypothetical protein
MTRVACDGPFARRAARRLTLSLHHTGAGAIINARW